MDRRGPDAFRRRSAAWTAWVLLWVVAATLRFALIERRALWYDEVASWRTQSFALPDLLRSCRSNVHPPGYFLILKLATAVLGDRPLVLRGFSGICSLLALLYAARLAGRFAADFGPYRAWAAAALLALSPLMVVYAREVRMYAPGALIALAGTYHTLRATQGNDDRHLLAAALWFAAGCYTHNFLLFHAYAFGLYVLYHAAYRGRWHWLVLAAVPGLLYLPWFPALLHQSEQVAQRYWIGAPTLQSTGDMLWQLWCGDLTSAGRLPSMAGYALTALALLAAVFGGAVGRFAALQFCAALGIGLALSLTWKPILYTRYLTPAFAVLIVGCVCTRLVHRRWDVLAWLPAGWLAIFFVAWLWQLWPTLTLDSRTGLVGAVRYVQQHRRAGEIVVCESPFVALPWMYYDRTGTVYLHHPGGHDRLAHYLGKALFVPAEVLDTPELERLGAAGVWDVEARTLYTALVDRYRLVTDETEFFRMDTGPPSRLQREFVVRHWVRQEPEHSSSGGSEQQADQAGKGGVHGEGQEAARGDDAEQPAESPKSGGESRDETDGE